MTITYSLWDGVILLGTGLTAKSASEMNKMVKELQTYSKNVTAIIRKIEQGK